MEDTFEDLLNGSVDAVVYDAPNLHYYANSKGSGKVGVVGKLFERQDYGLALPQGSPLREQFNRAILLLIESDRLEQVRTKWLGK